MTTTNMTHWGTVLGSKEGVYVLLGLCRRNPSFSAPRFGADFAFAEVSTGPRDESENEAGSDELDELDLFALSFFFGFFFFFRLMTRCSLAS